MSSFFKSSGSVDTETLPQSGSNVASNTENNTAVSSFFKTSGANSTDEATIQSSVDAAAASATAAANSATSASDSATAAANSAAASSTFTTGGGSVGGDVSITGSLSITGSVDGRDVAADGTKLDGIEAGATADQTDAEIKTAYENNSDTNAFTDALQTKLAGIETGATADQTAAEIRTLVDSATDSNVFTDADHTKLDGIETGADVTDTTNVVAALTAGTNVTIAADGTISSTDTDTTYSNATTSAAGLMSATDKTKLDGVETGATADQTASEIKSAYESNTDTNAFTDADHTKLDGIEANADVTDTTNVVAALTAGTNVTIGADGTISSTDTDTTYSNATTSASGLMSASDKTKIDGIESGATADQTASEILTAVKTVDGAASGLDADLLDGQHGSYYTGYTDTAVANLVDSAPTTLDTLNELAAALGDDANFSTTVTNSIATKLPLAGGTMTGNIVMSGAQTVDGRDLSVDGTKLDGIEAGADVTDTANVTAAGALMDSEVTNLAQVKAFDSSDYATAAQGTTADAALPKAGGTMTGGLVMSGGDIQLSSGDQLLAVSSGTTPFLDVRGGSGPYRIRFRPGSNFTDTADGVDIAYRTTPNDLLIERSENANKIAEFGGDDGHAKLLYNGSDRIETTSGGTTVTGNIVVSGDVTTDEVFLGSSTDHKIGKVNHTYGDGIGLTTDSGTVTIGQGNSSYVHYVNSNSVPHWFNQTVYTNGDFRFWSDTGALVWQDNRGTTYEVTLTTTTPTAAQTITLPDATGTVVVQDGSGVSVTGNLDVSDTTNPELNIYYNKASSTFAEDVGHINFHGIQNDGSSERFAQIAGYADATLDTGGIGRIHLNCLNETGTDDGTLVTGLKVAATYAEFNGDLWLNGAIKEKAYNLTGTHLDPGNGTVQYKTLTANTTFTEAFNTSESITLMINAAGYTVTWPTMTWVGGSAPTLAASGYTTVVLWELHQAGGLFGAVVS